MGESSFAGSTPRNREITYDFTPKPLTCYQTKKIHLGVVMKMKKHFLSIILPFFLLPTLPALGFTDDFAQFLSSSYPGLDFSGKEAGVNSSYGGKTTSTDAVVKRPVILIHGSTDRALGGHSGSWIKVIKRHDRVTNILIQNAATSEDNLCHGGEIIIHELH